MDIAMILNKIRPEAKWSLDDNRFETLVWLEDDEPPTYQEVLDAWEEVEITINNQRMERLRQEAYRNESDPLFFKYQRGDATKAEWLAKIEEIKQRYPYSAFSQE
jgi:hypothetical protein